MYFIRSKTEKKRANKCDSENKRDDDDDDSKIGQHLTLIYINKHTHRINGSKNGLKGGTKNATQRLGAHKPKNS